MLALFGTLNGEDSLQPRWWGNNKEKEREQEIAERDARWAAIPFSRIYIEPFCRRYIESNIYRARTTVYDFMLWPQDAEIGPLYVGNDTNLGVTVHIQMCGKHQFVPLTCEVHYDGGYLVASDIWFSSVNNKKRVYLISFFEVDSTLVIYRGKDQAITAHWALLTDKPR